MDMTMKMIPGRERLDQPSKCPDHLVRQVLTIVNAEWGRMGNKDI